MTVIHLYESARITEALLKAAQGDSGGVGRKWTEILTVRIGVVVLLLYLTTILLSTYRYTFTLAAYYTARGDAFQALSHRPSDRLIDLEELRSLVPLLSPDDYRIDKESVPYEHIGRSPIQTGT
jgi:hypothetical protein